MNKSKNQNNVFPVGYHSFHRKKVFNFQLNRGYSLGFTRFEDIETVGERIHTFEDWKNEMVKLAEKALSENHLLSAAYYYRAAEFYTFDDGADRRLFYDKFIQYFQAAIQEEENERFEIPYQKGFLPAIRVPQEGKKLGTIVLHGGFDSFLEEWYFMMKYLASFGYEVIGFEGPGQGAALRKYGLSFDIEWEKPVKAVLDFLHLSDITLFGLSMGGWLCIRATAFEPRIQRVIATGHAIDYMKCYPYLIRVIHLWFLKQIGMKGFMSKMAMKKAKANNVQGWMTRQLMYITQKDDPMEAFEVWLSLNEENIHSEKVTQDVLLLSGSEDHFIPIRMHQKQVEAMVNANSVTDRIFTKEEHAQNHCQIGNIKLLLDNIIDWLKMKGNHIKNE